MDIPYVVGQEYNRRQDIHGPYGGGQQSGMSPSGNYPLMFLFTGPGGEQHGYQTRSAHCRFLGECVYTGHHYESRPDSEGHPRQAIVFELAMDALTDVEGLVELEAEIPERLPPLPKNTSLAELRRLAETGSSNSVKPRSIQSRVYYRSIAVKQYALARAKGICESCGDPAPFQTKKGEPYLEVHHLFRVADGGPDKPASVAAICPTCHRRIHNGADGDETNVRLINTIEKLESV